MRSSVVGKTAGFLVALTLAAGGTLAGQDQPHPHPGGHPIPGDTVRGRVLGNPRGGPVHGGHMHGGHMHGGHMHGGHMHGGHMHGGMMSGPALMLMHRESLGLSPEQVQRLEVLAATQRREMERLMPEELRARSDLLAASSGEIDVKASRAAFDRMEHVHSEMLGVGLQAMKDARQTLTPEQRTRWDAMLSQMEE